VIIVEDIKVAEVESIDLIVTEKLTISKVVAIAMVVGEFRNQTREIVRTVVFIGTS
jgi:hypothetical protein